MSTDQKELNDQHATNPQVSDYWEEMFSPVAVVLAVNGTAITICRKTVPEGTDMWMWDLDKAETIDVSALKSWLGYKSGFGYWAYVHPGAMAEVVEEWNATNRNTAASAYDAAMKGIV